MAKFAKSFYKLIGDDNTSIVSSGKGSAEFTGYLDTGSYALNAILSGSIYGGVPDNKVTAFAGPQATGKTFFVLGVCKYFQDKNPEGIVVFYDSEGAVTRKMMEDRGLDVERVILNEPETVQAFKNHCYKTLKQYGQITDVDKPPMIIVLDSLGMLSTIKEVGDTDKAEDTRDMTRTQAIKAAFRVLTLQAAKVGVPIILTNHTYKSMNQYEPDVISGGSGLLYAASTIATLTKKKEKEGTEVIGNIVHVKMYKSRLSKENAKIDVKITYKHGLDKYYGILDLAEKYNVIKKVGNKYELSDGRKVFGKEINENPEEVYTKEILDQIDEAAKKEFMYGE
jgi:RecA/RadA recombinase